MAEKLVLVSSLEPLKKGDRFETWPLHVTILQWFSLPREFEPAFVNALANQAHATKPPVAVGDVEAMFGPEHDVRVRTLRSMGALAALHARVYETARRFDGIVDSPYVLRDYRPHVTYQGERGIAEGETVRLTAMQLIRGDVGGPRTIEHVFHLGQRD